jgi:hypothetical protein
MSIKVLLLRPNKRTMVAEESMGDEDSISSRIGTLSGEI